MEQKTEASQAVDERQLLDEDGENRAVRTFLMQYGVPSLTVGAMCQHMERSGWGYEYWPPFAKRYPAPRSEHLTKAGAQIWIRHLMSLERAALKAQPAEIDPALLRALKEACDLAMKNTVAARVPECGDFGAIAQNLDYALSQLKAQPAPTEAAQGMTNAERVQAMNPFKFVPWSKEAEMIEGWTKAEKERNEAQGEDSVRLDAADLATIEEATKVLESGAKHNLSMGRTVFAHVQADRASRLRAVLDRARASAETGGVKP